MDAGSDLPPEGGEQLRLAPAPPAETGSQPALRSLSVSSLVQMARCPKQFYWTVVLPIPRRPGNAARVGQQIHRWIELRSSGQLRLGAEFALPQETDEEGPAVALMKDNYEASRFAGLVARHTERPFELALPGGYVVRGRIDAVYVHDDGVWEVVDFKTGGRAPRGDKLARLQISTYALAAARLWDVEPRRLKLTYFYLRSGEEASWRGDELGLEPDELVRLFEKIHSGKFEATPGRPCFACDFLTACKAGYDFVRSTRR